MNMNVNDYVWVKLTAVGHRRLESNFRALGLDRMRTYEPPKEVEGWTKFQLWELMHEFGGVMFNGAQVPFETTFAVDDPTEHAKGTAK